MIRRRWAAVLLGGALLAAGAPCGWSADGRGGAGVTVWKGAVDLPEGYAVAKGERVLVEAGATVTLGGGRTIRVDGKIDIAGTAESPVRLLAGDPVSGGEGEALAPALLLGAGEEEATIEHLIMRGAGDGIVINRMEAHLRGVKVTVSGDGVRVENGGRVDGSDIELDGRRRGLAILLRSVGYFKRLRVAGGTIGIEVNTGGGLGLEDSRVEGREVGAALNQMERGVFDRVEFSSSAVGLIAHSVGPEVILRDVRFEGCGEGAILNAFAAPILQRVTFSGGRIGATVQNFAAPLITDCRFTGAGKGLLITLKSNPTVRGCCFMGNDVAIEVAFSSYPLIHFNSFSGNRTALSVGENQSADWEVRIGSWGLTRGQAVKSGSRRITEGGPGMRRQGTEPMPQNNFLEGWVDARWNWWGAEATPGILRGGAAADLPMIDDGRNRRSAAYEGYEGSYLVDRFEYWPVLEEPWDRDAVPCP